MSQDFEWLGKAFGIARCFIRRKIREKELQIKVFCFFTDRSTRILHEDDGLYTAGFVENQVERLLDNKLSKPIAGIKPSKPDTS